METKVGHQLHSWIQFIVGHIAAAANTLNNNDLGGGRKVKNVHVVRGMDVLWMGNS